MTDSGTKWTDKLKTTPLIVAVQNRNLDCVKILLEYKADIERLGDFVYGRNEIFLNDFY